MPVPGEELHADIAGGWCLPAATARQAVHTRSIVCRSCSRDDGMLDIDARFIDTRPFGYDSESRGACPPGAALQAFASDAHAPRQPGQAEPVRIWRLDALLDSGHSYRADGPVMQRLRQR